MSKIKEKAKENTAKRALKYLNSEAGGILEATSASSLPRSRQQFSDARRKNIDKEDHDQLYAVMYMCKEGEGQRCKYPFVRTVNAAPFPMMVLAFDYTLDDLVRFCTGEKHCVLGVDPTFNLGKFDVTVTTYQHLLLELKSSPEKSPTLLGPMFIHVCKDFAAYHFFSSALVGQRPKLSSVQAFGTDGEMALENAFMASFPSAQHVRCFLHFKGNIERKLQELKIPNAVRLEVVKDVLGNPSKLESGLVDAVSSEELDDQLSKFEGRWNELERPYNSPPFFYTWFVKHCRDNIAKYMLPECRTRAGLGSPPLPYYTNEVESKNKILKDEVDHKKLQLPDFVNQMKGLFEEQKNEIERSLIGTGEYRLKQEYSHLAVDPSTWFKMNSDQRQRKICRFMKAAVEASSDSCGVVANPLSTLQIPDSLKNSMWEKAHDLSVDVNAIVKAPGSQSAWMVKSYSSERPHYVKMSDSGGIVCDDQCLSYKSMKMCAHSLAVAISEKSIQKFLKWHHDQSHLPNFTALSEFGKSASVGKKTSQRGVTKKKSQQIKKVIHEAEESNLEWHKRVSNSQTQKEFEVSHQPLTQQPALPQLCVNAPLYTEWSPLVTGSATESMLLSANITNANIVYSNSPPPLIHAPAACHYPPPQLLPVQYSPQVFPSSTVYPAQFPTAGQSASQRQFVENPFWLTFVFGNISRCNGCKGKIQRGENKRPLPPPDDIVFGHREFVIFSNPRSGAYEQSKEKRNVYYHVKKSCVAPYFVDFDISSVVIPEDVKSQLQVGHKHHLSKEFNLIL